MTEIGKCVIMQKKGKERYHFMDLFDEAVLYATEKHSGQTRKLVTTPYILHPMEVAAIVGTMTDDQSTLAAAILHDTVEDTDATLEDIEEKFGRRVALIVMTETEEKREGIPPAETWKLRKEETLNMLENTKDMSVKMLWLGDKLSNIRSFDRELRQHGNGLWQKLNQKDPAEHEWYYRSIAAALSDLSGYDAYREYVATVDRVFDMVKGGKTNESQPCS